MPSVLSTTTHQFRLPVLMTVGNRLLDRLMLVVAMVVAAGAHKAAEKAMKGP